MDRGAGWLSGMFFGAFGRPRGGRVVCCGADFSDFSCTRQNLNSDVDIKDISLLYHTKFGARYEGFQLYRLESKWKKTEKPPRGLQKTYNKKNVKKKRENRNSRKQKKNY